MRETRYSVIRAISGGNPPAAINAMGVMEFYTISAAVVAADLAAKAADVRLMEVRLGLGIGGKSYVTLCGEVAAVQSAIDAGTVPSRRDGTLVSTCVIPSPRPEIFEAML